jgi:hypothetical protein
MWTFSKHGELRSVFKLLVTKLSGKRSFDRPSHRWRRGYGPVDRTKVAGGFPSPFASFQIHSDSEPQNFVQHRNNPVKSRVFLSLSRQDLG